MKTALLATIVALSLQLVSRAQAPEIADAPKAIQDLAASIQGKSPVEVRAAIVKHLGTAKRDVGSGLRIEQWDTSDGVLTFHPLLGATFVDPKAKKFFRLIRTTNPLRACLLQSYEMTTLPIPEETIVARLIFSAVDGKHQATFSISSSERSRRLDFSADKPLSFLMDTSWRSFWK